MMKNLHFRLSGQSGWRLLLWPAIIISILVFLKNAWVSEDAYILFRSIEQLFAGNGPVWNPHERVQVFTSPLWFWVLASTRFLSTDLFLNTILLSLFLWLVCLCGLWRLRREPIPFLLTVSLLLVSNAFFDFTSSGLENILAYTLLVFFLYFGIRSSEPFEQLPKSGASRVPATRFVLILAGLLLVVRHDLLPLILPATLFVSWHNRKFFSRRELLLTISAAALPLVGWTLFSLIYYGFPLPNTAYAKLNTGVPKSELLAQGVGYLRASANFDSLTTVVILLAIFKLLTSTRLPIFRFLGLGIVLHSAYVVYIGGDFMQGRFLSYSMLLSAATLPLSVASRPRTVGLPLLGVVWIYALLFPHTPVNSPLDYQNRSCLEHMRAEPILDSVADERGFYFRSLSFVNYVRTRWEGRFFPTHPWARKGRFQRADASRVLISRNIGLFGYYSSLDRILLDPAALSDPLLARLRVRGKRRIGHFDRALPDGYVASVQSRQARLADPDLNLYYQKIRLITQSPSLFSAERLKAILWMNLGRFEYLKENYHKRPDAPPPPLYTP